MRPRSLSGRRVTRESPSPWALFGVVHVQIRETARGKVGPVVRRLAPETGCFPLHHQVFYIG